MNKFINYKTSSFVKEVRIFALCESATVIGIEKEAHNGEDKTVLTISIDKAEKKAFSEAINGKDRLTEAEFAQGKQKRKKALNEYFDSLIEE